KDWGFDTLQVHAGQVPDPVTGARALPIYQTTAYVFRDAQHAADLFSLKEEGNIYTRLQNPTTDVLEKRVAALEGGIGALATGSGMSAIMLACLNIVETGQEIVASSALYGGTFNLFAVTFKKLGIKVHFVDPKDLEGFRKAINEKTRAVYVENISNPSMAMVDMEAVAAIAHEHGLPLLVDATFTTPYLSRPFEFGADIVIHSATKYLGGHGNSLGGIIVDSGQFDWNASGLYPGLTEPDESYHGIRYVQDFGAAAFIVKARVQMMRDMGPAISPMNSWLILQGIETLSLRMRKHVENANAVAAWLKTNPNVSWLNYPADPDHPDYPLVQKYMPKGIGAIFSFGLKGGLAAGKKFIESVQLLSHVTNVGDTRSIVTHPGSTTHQQMSEEDQIAAGVNPELIRVSLGLEDAKDIIADMAQAMGMTVE
ncbi:MAG TPA: bifunctional O-acetylhomoserine aminocarboxypropyltransferase/cysteine synthase, partial [Peptococcaceae bacterium]|nr:bifunctional O-acetylhomoserine aminocarboxypropyltransferase/cysteine synthase [Peptococcaceae bacterium]